MVHWVRWWLVRAVAASPRRSSGSTGRCQGHPRRDQPPALRWSRWPVVVARVAWVGHCGPLGGGFWGLRWPVVALLVGWVAHCGPPGRGLADRPTGTWVRRIGLGDRLAATWAVSAGPGRRPTGNRVRASRAGQWARRLPERHRWATRRL